MKKFCVFEQEVQEAEEAAEDMLDDSRYVGQRIDWL